MNKHSLAAKTDNLYSLYEQIEALPEGVTGEIIDGILHTVPRPSLKGRGGPGGWWILDEPEVHFELDKEDSKWQSLGFFRDNEKVNVAPFDAITLILSDFRG